MIKVLKIHPDGKELVQYKQTWLDRVNRMERHQILKTTPWLSILRKTNAWTTSEDTTRRL